MKIATRCLEARHPSRKRGEGVKIATRCLEARHPSRKRGEGVKIATRCLEARHPSRFAGEGVKIATRCLEAPTFPRKRARGVFAMPPALVAMWGRSVRNVTCAHDAGAFAIPAVHFPSMRRRSHRDKPQRTARPPGVRSESPLRDVLPTAQRAAETGAFSGERISVLPQVRGRDAASFPRC
nr:hypothetical protein [Gammaproteobacteria bacterium]